MFPPSRTLRLSNRSATRWADHRSRMAIFDRSALNEGVKGREVLAWSAYDFANSGYTTVVLTAVFNAYFVGVVAEGADWGTLAWTAILGFSNLAVLLTMPAIGTMADRNASKK